MGAFYISLCRLNLLYKKLSSPRYKRYRSQQHQKFNIFADCCSPLANARTSARLELPASFGNAR